MPHPLPENKKVYSKFSIKIFLVCLLLSFSFWLSIKLSNKYTELISYKVNYITPYDKVFYRFPEDKLFIRQQGSGYSLLMNKFSNSISVKLSDVVLFDQKEHYWLPNKHLRIIGEEVGNAQIISINPSKLRLPLTDLASKKLPIRADIKINYREGFKKKRISIDQEKIMVTGPSNLLSSMKFVSTEKWISPPLDSNVEKNLKLKLPDHVKTKISKLKLNIEVEPYTEDSIQVSVRVLNPYKKRRIQLFPDSVKLFFKVGYDKYKKTIPSDFSVICDLNQLEENINVLPLKLVKAPSYLKEISIVPDRVEVVAEN